MIISANCGIEPTRNVYYKPMLDQAIELSGVAPKHCIILQRKIGLNAEPVKIQYNIYPKVLSKVTLLLNTLNRYNV